MLNPYNWSAAPQPLDRTGSGSWTRGRSQGCAQPRPSSNWACTDNAWLRLHSSPQLCLCSLPCSQRELRRHGPSALMCMHSSTWNCTCASPGLWEIFSHGPQKFEDHCLRGLQKGLPSGSGKHWVYSEIAGGTSSGDVLETSKGHFW